MDSYYIYLNNGIDKCTTCQLFARISSIQTSVFPPDEIFKSTFLIRMHLWSTKLRAINTNNFTRNKHDTLPETNIAPENQWLEDEFPFGKASWQVLCSFSGRVNLCKSNRKPHIKAMEVQFLLGFHTRQRGFLQIGVLVKIGASKVKDQGAWFAQMYNNFYGTNTCCKHLIHEVSWSIYENDVLKLPTKGEKLRDLLVPRMWVYFLKTLGKPGQPSSGFRSSKKKQETCRKHQKGTCCW